MSIYPFFVNDLYLHSLSVTAMAAELGFQSQQSEDHHQPAPPGFTVGSWVWNPMRTRDEDDSWEVRAFAEDAGSIMGTTWPPRSYTCTFCGREFRSAQALGGHMNVHRRDRARLQQSPPKSMVQSGSLSSPSSPLIFPPQELVSSGGLCLLYGLQVPNPGFTHENGSIQLRSTLSSSPYLPNYKLRSSIPASVFFQLAQPGNSEISSSSNSHLTKLDEHPQIVANDEHEELDLELRLGHGRPP